MATFETSEGPPAVVALLGAGGAVERATTRFVERYGAKPAWLGSHHSEVERVLAGELDDLTVEHDGLAVNLSSVVASTGQRYALLTVPHGTGDVGRPEQLLDDAIDASLAIVWLKDLDGRYTRVNRRFTEALGTDADRICGRTDAELGPNESIERPRLRANDLLRDEPLELEYTVAASGDRPAYTVLRFALRDPAGEPTALCGVAAPRTHASLASSECQRLRNIERWSRLDETAILEALLREWEVVSANPTAPAAVREPEALSTTDDGERFAAVVAERDAALETSAVLEGQLGEERGELATLRKALERARAEEGSALGELRQELERARAEAAAALEAERASVDTLREELVATNDELHRAREAQESAVADAREELERARTEAANALELERKSVEALREELGAAREELERARDVQAAEAGMESALAQAREELERARTESAAALEMERENVEALREELGAAQDEIERVREVQESALAEAREALEQSQSEAAGALETERGNVESLREELNAAREELERARDVQAAEAGMESALAQAREELERARAEAAAALEAERASVDALREQLSVSNDELEHARQAEAEALAQAREELERARAEAAAAVDTERGNVESLREELKAAYEALERAQALEQADSEAQLALAQAHEELERVRAEGGAALDSERQTVHSLLEELGEAYRELERAREADRDKADALAELATVREELDRAYSKASGAETDLDAERRSVETLRADLAETHEELERVRQAREQATGDAIRVQELEQNYLRAEQAATEAQSSLAQARAQLDQSEARAAALAARDEEQAATVEALRGELAASQAQLEEWQEQAGGDEVAQEVEAFGVEESESVGPVWDAASQHRLSAALAKTTEWRTALKQAVTIIGGMGKWDAAIAWCPDDRGGLLKCAAMWTRDAQKLSSFETRTWQQRVRITGAELAGAGDRTLPTCVLELEESEDPVLRAAGEEGMGSALLVPIKSGRDTVAVLELLSTATTPPASELTLFLDAIAIQLGMLVQQEKAAHAHHWYIGRL